MRRSFLVLPLALAACSVQQGGEPCSAPTSEPSVRLELSLDPDRPRRHFSWNQARLRLINEGAAPITVIAPGDGSTLGFRTPHLEWIVTTEDGHTIDRGPSFGCGTINPLKADEIIALGPGEDVVFEEWIGSPRLSDRQVHLISVRYTNDPSSMNKEFALESGLPWVLYRARRSTPLSVTSNTIRYEHP